MLVVSVLIIAAFISCIYFCAQEVFEINQLAELVKDMLMKFYIKYHKAVRPQHIIFYRDGVSEGQFREVS